MAHVAGAGAVVVAHPVPRPRPRAKLWLCAKPLAKPKPKPGPEVAATVAAGAGEAAELVAARQSSSPRPRRRRLRAALPVQVLAGILARMILAAAAAAAVTRVLLSAGYDTDSDLDDTGGNSGNSKATARVVIGPAREARSWKLLGSYVCWLSLRQSRGRSRPAVQAVPQESKRKHLYIICSNSLFASKVYRHD